jgi:predicted  nucleic acid-binding Zn-ribbon protein
MTPEEHEAAVSGLRHARDHQLAVLFMLQLQMAVEIFPEEARKALAQVYDLEAVEADSRRMMAVLAATQEAADRARWAVQDLGKELDRLGQRIEGMECRLDEAAKAFVAIQKGKRS